MNILEKMREYANEEKVPVAKMRELVGTHFAANTLTLERVEDQLKVNAMHRKNLEQLRDQLKQEQLKDIAASLDVDTLRRLLADKQS